MTFEHILILMLTGSVSGFAGGLLGLGGAFIMTPVQYAVYSAMGMPPDLAVKTAFGTSLAVVLPTAISGALKHHRNKAVIWRAAIIMGGCGLVFSFGGATLATHLSAATLKIAFSIVVLLAGIRMLFTGEPKYKIEAVSQTWKWIVWAIPAGIVSGFFGVGGGIVMIPVLVLALRFEMHYAVGTSMGAIILTSIGGILGYIINGMDTAGRLPYSLGYVDLTSWLLLAFPSTAMAQFGAAAAHRLPRRALTYIFVIVQLYMGLRMAGLFEWLGWPL